MKRRLAAAFLAAIVVAIPAAAQAAAPTQGTPAAVNLSSQVTKADVAVLAPYVSTTSTGYSLKAPSSVLATIDPAALSTLQAYWGQVAKFVASGDLVYRSGDYVSPVKSSFVKGFTTWRGSHGYIKTHWYGLEVGVDAYLRDKISGGLALGAVAAALGSGPWAVPVAAALGAAAGVLLICEHTNGWSYVYWVGAMPPAGTIFCNPFG